MAELLRLFGLGLLAVGAGVSFVVQQAVNATLRSELASPAWAGFVSYLGGTIAMLAVIALSRDPLPAWGAVARSSWWSWSGGVFGAAYIVIAILLLPRLGAATVVALIVVGQMLASLAFDHFALFGLAQHPADATRILGAVLLIAGVVLIRI